jgi:N-acetylglucosaminyldiphosphoundecaprenol N-acetyl-beta-D-mannosaminyltransferase
MRFSILQVPVDGVSRNEAVRRIAGFLGGVQGRMVTTPNPEMLVAASRSARFRDVLRSADLAVPDGIGLVYAARWLGHRVPERVSGADLVDDISALAAAQGRSLYLLGAEEGIAAMAAETLRVRYPDLRIVGASSGGRLRHDGEWVIEGRELEKIAAAAPDILLVAFGHGKQEEWIAAHLPDLPSVKVAMGVGGTFDFLAGKAARAPAAMRRLGLEWAWRLVREPWRFRRIVTAVLVFPWLVLREKR